MSGGLRSTAGPVDDRKLAGLIEPVIAAVGMDLESVRMTVAGRRRLLRVVVDSDHGVSLDDAADVSREVSALLDASDVLGDTPYTLEVSSPGVDRPLTEPRHWRRARGRLVRVKVTGEGSVEGRVLAADADGITLALADGERPGGRAGSERRFSYADLGAGRVQVEFGRIPDAELDEFTGVARGDGASYPSDNSRGDDPSSTRHAGPVNGKNTGPAETGLDDEADLGAGGDGH